MKKCNYINYVPVNYSYSLRRYGNKLICNLQNMRPRDYYPQMQVSTTEPLHVPTFVGTRDTEAVNSSNQSQTKLCASLTRSCIFFRVAITVGVLDVFMIVDVVRYVD